MQVLAYVTRMTKKIGMLPPGECPKGSAAVNPALPAADATHFTKHTPLYGPFEGKQQICFGMRCTKQPSMTSSEVVLRQFQLRSCRCPTSTTILDFGWAKTIINSTMRNLWGSLTVASRLSVSVCLDPSRYSSMPRRLVGS